MKNKSIVALGTVLLASTLINNPIEAEASYVPDYNTNNFISNDKSIQYLTHDEATDSWFSGYMFTRHNMYAYTVDQIDNHDFSNPVKLDRNTEVFVASITTDDYYKEEYVPITYKGQDLRLFVGRTNGESKIPISEVLSYTMVKDEVPCSFVWDTLQGACAITTANMPVYDNSEGKGEPIGYLADKVQLTHMYLNTYNFKTGMVSFYVKDETLPEDAFNPYKNIYLDARNITLAFLPSNFQMNMSSTIKDDISDDVKLAPELNDSLSTYSTSMTLYEWMEKSITSELIEHESGGVMTNAFTFDFMTTPESVLKTHKESEEYLKGFVNKYPYQVGVMVDNMDREAYKKKTSSESYDDYVININKQNADFAQELLNEYADEYDMAGRHLL